MKNLDGDKSWKLLLQTAFFGSGNHEGFPKQLEKKGREMLMRKCGGLPLAIKEVGRHWAEKRRSGSEWKELVVEESFMNLELTETLAVLESTYLNMDPKVKPCFLCLAFFKEGTIIRYKKLHHIFTAGLPGCYARFSELMEQSIIEKVDETKSHQTITPPRIKAIRINPVFHRLSIIKAVDEIGFEILRKDGSNRASHEPCRHRVIHCSREDKFNYNYSSTNQDEHLVSLFFHGGGGLSDICWKHFEQLKVLDMEGFGLKILPEMVGDLTELRYLGLRNNYIQELPQSLRHLKKLEIFDIAQNFMVEVPDILWEMDHLRHLYMSDIICQKPLKIDTLMNLETLTYITVDDWTYDVSDMKNKMASLCRLGIEEVDGNTNLWKLVLVNSCLAEDPMPILEKLPRLYDLKLQNAYTGHEMVISSAPYHLVIRELWNLRNIVKVGESVWSSSLLLSCLEVMGFTPAQVQLLWQDFMDSKRDDILIEKMENKALQQMLHQHLHHKPYVIVLDDVSEVTDLQYVFRTLPQDKRSRFLFTTRSHQISCNPYGDCAHKMKNLDGDKSWQLLLQTTLCSDKEFPKQLEKKGREMLMRKCGGLPLAIKEVGRQWAEKRRSGSKWKELVVEESLMNLVLSETLEVMEWTYLNMDAEVKPYFLRLAFFKEGTIIRKEKLIQIWTAGGPKEYQSELGFINLSQESFIEKVDKTIYSTKSIRINPIFHRLSIRKAVDEIGFEILRKDGSNRASHEPPHHRVIHCSRYDKFNYNYSSTNQDGHLVSLFFHGGGGYSSVCHPSYWKHFEQLKVLDMEGFGLKILPETVGDLIELRYLGLRNNYIQELPQSLRCLKKLEVLDIFQNIMVEVPDILWEMDCLRHLYMSNIICLKPLKIDALMNLETLTYITVDDWTYEVSDMKNKMISLRRLGIEEVDENSNVSKLFASLAELENLYYLILRGFRFRSMPSLDELGLLKNITKLKLKGCLTRLPSATNFPPNIFSLSLVNSCLDEDPIPILEMLPQLSDLKLQNAYTGHEMSYGI
ncbi:hypothetical protein C2S52_023522 [Perilla frutescens var. hirtella]|nr:hypothetical protein C2S52_023522 [Perilla frutescens var. hirtella]